ncbi:MAG: sugar phosphate nucleotidyltransferase [Actinomycetota bacterium]|nr:sugar phosphate nucleotidyltransferase [Actinomycetota bacterium]
MRAIILAGGKGTRLAPYTVTFPKPLVPIGDLPVLEIVIRQLAASGFERITLAVGHLANLLQAYFEDGSRWGVEIDYSFEHEPLGTVGPLTLIEDLPEHFLVMNGDLLTTLPYRDLFDAHVKSGVELTVACHRMNVNVDLGVIEFDGQHRVTGYREKPTISYDASMGVYAFSKSALSGVVPGEYMDFPTLVMDLMSEDRAVKAHLADCRWLDIGRHDDYAQAIETFEALRSEFLSDEAPGDATA